MWFVVWMGIGLTVVVLGQQPCDPKFCNYEGVCTLRGGKPTCACIGEKYFRGEFCKEIVDNCEPSPCQGGVECTSGIGQFYCEPCPDGLSGRTCSVQNKDIPTKIEVHMSRYADYGQRLWILITVESLGTTPFSLKIVTKDYAIDMLELNNDMSNAKDYWRYCDDLRKYAKYIGIKHTYTFTNTQGYYHVKCARFWNVGEQNIEVSLVDLNTAEPFYEQSFTLLILKPERVKCIPDVILKEGSDPNNKIQLNVGRYKVYRPWLRQPCHKNSKFEYCWTLHGTSGDVLLHNFGCSENSYLKVPSYFMVFRYLGATVRSFMLRIEVREQFEDECIKKVLRCYIFVPTAPVEAIIRGGQEHEIASTDVLKLDGTKSRDFALRPNIRQTLKYRWSCESADDSDNRGCQENVGHEKILKILANTLATDRTYRYTLTVTSSVNPSESDSVTQLVRVVAEPNLQLHIVCLRNCAKREIASGTMLHVRAVCDNCGASGGQNQAKTMTYQWRKDGNDISGNKQLFSNKINLERDVIIELTVNDPITSKTGRLQYPLKYNRQPDGGTCSIEPNSGVEFETEFVINCENYASDNMPLSYAFKAGSILLERTSFSPVSLRLPQSATTAGVSIHICDSFNTACKIEKIQVTVERLAVPTEIEAVRNFLRQRQFKNLLHRGNQQAAFVLAMALLNSIDINDLATIEVVTDQFEDFELTSMVDIERYSSIVSIQVVRTQPTNLEALSLSTLFAKLANGLEYNLNDEEATEMHKTDYNALQQIVFSTLLFFIIQNEPYIKSQAIKRESVSIENAFFEKYEVLTDFDTTIATRVKNWLEAGRQLDRCVHLIGCVGAMSNQMDYFDFVSGADSAKHHQMFYLDGMEEYILDKSAVYLTISVPLMTALQNALHSDGLFLQFFYFITSPFWWFPIDYEIQSGIYYLNVHGRSKKVPCNHEIKLEEYFEADITVQELPVKDVMSGMVNVDQKCLTHMIVLSSNGLLEIKFVELTAAIRIKLELYSPTGYELRKSKTVLNDIATQNTFYLFNKNSESTDAYLVVTMADNVQSAEYKFTAVVRECVSWSFASIEPEWTTTGCQAQLAPNLTDKVRCHCYHFSIFAVRLYEVAVESYYGTQFMESEIPINWAVVAFYPAIFMAPLLLLLISYICSKREKDYVTIDSRFQQPDQAVLVHITTGYLWNARTTSDISFEFICAQGSNVVTVYQYPKRFSFRTTSTCTLRLSSKIVSLPLKLIISHDASGPYKSWYCESIEIIDLKRKQHHIFYVNQWIRSGKFTLDSNSSSMTLTKWEYWKMSFLRLVFNWAKFQPFLGPWQYGPKSMNRLLRSCIFISKFSTHICIIACSIGKTTIVNFESSTQSLTFRITATSFFIVTLSCFAASLFIDLIFFIISHCVDIRDQKKRIKRIQENRRNKKKK